MSRWNWYLVGPMLLFFTVTFLFTWYIRGRGFGEFVPYRWFKRKG